MYMATLFSVFVSCKKQTKRGHEVELTAIIQFDEAPFFTLNMYGN